MGCRLEIILYLFASLGNIRMNVAKTHSNHDNQTENALTGSQKKQKRKKINYNVQVNTE